MNANLNAPLQRGAPSGEKLFKSFFMGGFECSTHRIATGRRLDLAASTRHDEFCLQDYQRLLAQGIGVAREGLRWHLIEKTPGNYDFSSAQKMVSAARETGVQVLWDLCHYGWPDFYDIWKPEFVCAFGNFAAAFARWISDEMDGPHFITPINEISFWSWAGGDVAYFPPRCRGRGLELKHQLVRAATAAMESFSAVQSNVRFLQIEPLVHLIGRSGDEQGAENYRLAQYQANDMIRGDLWPQLGGDPRWLDVVGCNFYPNNQWVHNGNEFLQRTDPRWRPLREMLDEIFLRYHRPIFIAETGCENGARAGWLNYVCEETHAAMARGVAVHGICLYPILNHPGWDDDRHCHNGLWDYADARGGREIFSPLADEIQKWRRIFEPDAIG